MVSLERWKVGYLQYMVYSMGWCPWEDIPIASVQWGQGVN